MIENVYEELLQSGRGAGAIFALKNFGWTDKSEVSIERDSIDYSSMTDEELESRLIDSIKRDYGVTLPRKML